MVTAKFGSKQFKVTPKTIYTPSGFSTSESIDLEETERSGKKPSVKVKGVKLQTASFTVLLDARFVNVATEIQWWKSTLRAKSPKDLYYGNSKVGKFYLTQVDEAESNINKSGVYTKAKLSLSFTECPSGSGSSSSKSNSSASSVKASASSKTKKSIKKGSVVKPKSGTRWYSTAENAIKKKGTSKKASVKNYNVTNTYKSPIEAVHLGSSGWMRVEDVTVVKY